MSEKEETGIEEKVTGVMGKTKPGTGSWGNIVPQL